MLPCGSGDPRSPGNTVDTLRKMGLWIWLFKELLILVILVGVLCYRVYGVVNPPPPKNAEKPARPSDVLDPGNEPPAPVPPPPPDIAQGYAEIYSRNPFRYEAVGASGSSGPGAQDPGIVLRDIKELNGVLTARLRVKSTGTDDWHTVDESFQGYLVTDIDAEAKTVTVYVEEFKKSFTLSKTP